MSRGWVIALVIGIVLLGVLTLASAAVLVGVAGLPRTGSVAVVRVEGAIESGAGSPWSADTVTDRMVIADLERAAGDASVAAVVLYVSSPGGSVVASDTIYRAVAAMDKPVVAYLGEVAASGGYYVALGADAIVAHPSCITGSIGAVATAINAQELLEELGIQFQVIKSGDAKDMGSPHRPLEPEEQAFWQALIDEAYQGFVDIVAAERDLPVEAVLEVADGRILSGARANELGLVDRVGTMDDAVGLAAELAGVRGEPRVVETRVQRSLFEGLWPFFGSAHRWLTRLSEPGMSLQYRYIP